MLKLAPMPRAGHSFTCDLAFRQRPDVIEGVEVAVDIEQGEPLAVDLDPSCLTGRDLVSLRYFQKLSHTAILQLSDVYAACRARSQERGGQSIL